MNFWFWVFLWWGWIYKDLYNYLFRALLLFLLSDWKFWAQDLLLKLDLVFFNVCFCFILWFLFVLKAMILNVAFVCSGPSIFHFHCLFVCNIFVEIWKDLWSFWEKERTVFCLFVKLNCSRSSGFVFSVSFFGTNVHIHIHTCII